MTDPSDFSHPIALSRDCPAILIPEGTPVVLKTKEEVWVTQALGGSVTVNVNGNLARISAENLDALGMESEDRSVELDNPNDDGSVDIEMVWEQLSTCYDPEIPINIVELGLIYRCEVTAQSHGNRIEIDMTLTAPGCGMGPFLVEDVRAKIGEIPNVSDVDVELVFDPPWSPEMMSEAARLQTGLL